MFIAPKNQIFNATVSKNKSYKKEEKLEKDRCPLFCGFTHILSEFHLRQEKELYSKKTREGCEALYRQ